MTYLKLTFALIIFILSTNIYATTYQFYQGGYSEGAFISGTFTGEDSNNDNQLSTFGSNEITDFTLSFSGNSIVSEFSFSYSDALVLNVVYNLLNGQLLGDETGVVNSGESEAISFSDHMYEIVYGAGEAASLLEQQLLNPLAEMCIDGGNCGVVINFDVVDFSQELVSVSVIPDSIPVSIPSGISLFSLGLIGLLGFARNKNLG